MSIVRTFFFSSDVFLVADIVFLREVKGLLRLVICGVSDSLFSATELNPPNKVSTRLYTETFGFVYCPRLERFKCNDYLIYKVGLVGDSLSTSLLSEFCLKQAIIFYS